jgi:hypothetical protein
MTPTPHHPFSDLTPEQIRSLVRAAEAERAKAIGDFFAALFRRGRRGLFWPARRREAQIWPPRNVPALSPTVYR